MNCVNLQALLGYSAEDKALFYLFIFIFKISKWKCEKRARKKGEKARHCVGKCVCRAPQNWLVRWAWWAGGCARAQADTATMLVNIYICANIYVLCRQFFGFLCMYVPVFAAVGGRRAKHAHLGNSFDRIGWRACCPTQRAVALAHERLFVTLQK